MGKWRSLFSCGSLFRCGRTTTTRDKAITYQNCTAAYFVDSSWVHTCRQNNNNNNIYKKNNNNKILLYNYKVTNVKENGVWSGARVICFQLKDDPHFPPVRLVNGISYSLLFFSSLCLYFVFSFTLIFDWFYQ